MSRIPPPAAKLAGRSVCRRSPGWLPSRTRRGSDDGRTLVATRRGWTAHPAADDNADMRDYVRRLPLGDGYDVEVVADGSRRSEAARRQTPDLVLADVMMPRLTAPVAGRRPRRPGSARNPRAALSARGRGALRGLCAGADDYLTKPFSARELLVRVGSTLQACRLRRERSAHCAKSAHARHRQPGGHHHCRRTRTWRAVQSVTDAATELTGAEFGSFFYNVVDASGEKYMLYDSGCRASRSRSSRCRATAVFAPTFAGTWVSCVPTTSRKTRYGHAALRITGCQGHLPVRSYLAVPVTSIGRRPRRPVLWPSSPGVFRSARERLAVSIAAQAATHRQSHGSMQSRRAQDELPISTSVLEGASPSAPSSCARRASSSSACSSRGDGLRHLPAGPRRPHRQLEYGRAADRATARRRDPRAALLRVLYAR